ncbi:cytosolic Fe-S cluster assembly factor NUBP1 homolog [Ctenocephalides felis]|uniref:cytosolic Fe-S cluster assembly factor NUBP1 homolog n=1 Tax=Ctenocephalides felis TaxID=7515 RepID=UPI000E6E30D0|nr:cytosolic Fe-S cluster assembly factor NUBP1 homolog [Ctenocephalides felis]
MDRTELRTDRIGVLDFDICGPSQPRCFGVLQETVHSSGSGWSPVFINDNLCIMSIGFFINPDDAVIWRGPKKNGMIQKFLSQTDWGTDMEYLLMDTPPGTSDEHLSAHTYLKECDLTGAIIITTPQEVALLDVRKEIDFCRKVGIPVLGVIENMSLFICPKCTHQSEIFPARTGGAQKMCNDLNLKLLGSMPLEPKLARSCDEGKDYLEETSKETPAVQALKTIVENLLATLPES